MTKDAESDPPSPTVSDDDDADYHSTFLDHNLVQLAERELRETPARRQRDTQILREMIRCERDLDSRTDNAFLVRFLRCRKFDCSRAYKVLKQYYKLRCNNAQLFVNFYPSFLKETYDHNLQTILPDRDPNGCAVFIFKGGKEDSGLWNPYTCKSEDIFRANVLCLEQAILDPVTQVTGIVAIMDMKGFGFTHIRFCPPSNLQKVVSLIQDCFPARFKAIHVVNEPAIFSMMFSIVRRFLNEKLQQRIHFHGCDMSSLHQFIPAEILPEEYGGFNGPMDNSDFVARLYRNDELFKKDSEYGYKTRVKA
ncbi:phosphatidylinositol transfer protein SEC14, putative [Ixodes scapularis]|uniref:Phosphatidylinositol transfer protein SEC14, putative n=1 Tax=Ixodes scapularis TaxID=6945 RepID=B7PQU9_IXOSC|nr:phosphatidylinositol transfer protein SEC14, putative [Ixodes scapularis]|eukprot:XP_002436141.1 phosphatidylinositol transfer protein SEC14, putative [Ixodes scapularis]